MWVAWQLEAESLMRQGSVLSGGHSGYLFPAVASIEIGPSSENPGINPGGLGPGGGDG